MTKMSIWLQNPEKQKHQQGEGIHITIMSEGSNFSDGLHKYKSNTRNSSGDEIAKLWLRLFDHPLPV